MNDIIKLCSYLKCTLYYDLKQCSNLLVKYNTYTNNTTSVI